MRRRNRGLGASPGTDTPAATGDAPERAGLVLASLILVAAVANLNLSVANVALPEIGESFDSSQTMLNLIAVGYSLGLAAIVLLFLTKPLQYMPEAVLSSVVFLIGVELVKVTDMKKIFRVRRDEFVVAAITAAVVVVVGVEQAILLAIVLSIVDHLRRGYKPNDTVLVRGSDDRLVNQPAVEGGQAAPGLVVYRFAASLYYANANRFEEEVRAITAVPGLKWLCLDAGGIGGVDYSAGESLRELHDELREQDIRLVFAGVTPPVREEIDQLGITEIAGNDAYFDEVQDVLDAYGRGA
jgi:MFS superfamily sulfate permease-like transporter